MKHKMLASFILAITFLMSVNAFSCSGDGSCTYKECYDGICTDYTGYCDSGTCVGY